MSPLAVLWPARDKVWPNFLRDAAMFRLILDAIDPPPGERLPELESGQVALTGGLLTATGPLDAVELDRDLITPPAQTCGPWERCTSTSPQDLTKHPACTGVSRSHAGSGYRPGVAGLAAGTGRIRESGQGGLQKGLSDLIFWNLGGTRPGPTPSGPGRTA